VPDGTFLFAGLDRGYSEEREESRRAARMGGIAAVMDV
jgi:hypothetical protein